MFFENVVQKVNVCHLVTEQKVILSLSFTKFSHFGEGVKNTQRGRSLKFAAEDLKTLTPLKILNRTHTSPKIAATVKTTPPEILGSKHGPSLNEAKIRGKPPLKMMI